MARIVCLLIALLTAACGRTTTPPTPSPPTTGGGETITGRERVGWDQPSADTAELATYRYAIYVDGARSVVAEVTCAATAGAGGFACSGRLPGMPAGAHTLELAAFIDVNGVLESPKSAPLRVTVVAATVSAPQAPLATGEILATADGVRLQALLVASGLDQVVDIAMLPDGRVAIAERAGRILVVAGTAPTDVLGGRPDDPPVDGGILSLAVDSDVVRTGHVFVVHTPPGSFRLVRYRLVGGALVDRVPIIRDVPASTEPAAVLRTGPDAKLYAAFDDGGNRAAAARPSEWSGKVLRLNDDGGTPDDQPAASPVFWSGLRSPRGIAWTADGGMLWIAEQSADGMERIRALVTGAERPRRAGQRAARVLPQPLGARALAVYQGDDIPQFRGDLFIAGSDAAYLLRVRFDPSDASRPVSSERLLDGRIGPVRAVAAAGDSLVVAGESAVWRLQRAR